MRAFTRSEARGPIDRFNLEAALKSTQETRVLNGLSFAHDLLISESKLESEIITSVTECLGSESNRVRENALRLIQTLYSIKGYAVQWNEVNPAIINELNEVSSVTGSGDKGTLAAVIGVLSSLKDYNLIHFLSINDPSSVYTSIKNCLVSPDHTLRQIAIIGFGKLIIRILYAYDIDGFTLEGHIKYELSSDCHRQREDLFDFISEVMRSYVKGVIGETPQKERDMDSVAIESAFIENNSIFDSYSEVLLDLIAMYNSYECNPVGRWTAALLGLEGCVENSSYCRIRRQAKWQEIPKQISLLIRTIFVDKFILSHRRRRFPNCDSYSHLISQIYILLLNELPYHPSSALTRLHILTPAEKKSIFAVRSPNDPPEDETLESRQGDYSFPLLSFLNEWIQNDLLASCNLKLTSSSVHSDLNPDLNTPYLSSRRTQLFEALTLLEHPLMRTMRLQVRHCSIISVCLLGLIVILFMFVLIDGADTVRLAATSVVTM